MLGAKWCTVILLLIPCLFGIVHFGPRAALILLVAVSVAVLTSVLPRLMDSRPCHWFNPGTIITGLLIGMTVTDQIPIYMVIAGVIVAEMPAKLAFKWFHANPFNPALLGRGFIAILESIDPRSQGLSAARDVDLVSGASVLFKDEGGLFRPGLLDSFLGFTPGSIGDTSALALILCGFFLLRYVVLKREACLSMILSVPLFVFLLPETNLSLGHAPWVSNPALYLIGGPTLLCAVFFLTDPSTTPRTRIGSVLFGLGAAFLGVMGRKYTQIPGVEMYGILVMNFARPLLDRVAIKLVPLRDSNDSEPLQEHESSGFVSEVFTPTSGSCPSFETYQKKGEFSCIKSLISSGELEKVPGRLKKLGHTGRGGGHFPVWKKWESALRSGLEPYLIVNAQEGDPFTFKDRYLMQNHIEVVAESIAIAAMSLKARKTLVVLSPEMTKERRSLAVALRNLNQIPGVEFQFEMRRGDGSYICGEESALIHFLEHSYAQAQERPPHPTEQGLHAIPTVVQNLETLSWLPLLLSNSCEGGDQSYLVSISGAVNSPGVYEVKKGTLLNQLAKIAGGELNGGQPSGYILAGVGGVMIPSSLGAVPYDPDKLSKMDATIGTGSFRVLPPGTCVVEESLRDLEFLAAESCGRCTPCRVGLSELAESWAALCRGEVDSDQFLNIQDLKSVLQLTSACGLGRSAPAQIHSILRHWPEEIVFHLRGLNSRRCRQEPTSQEVR
jgi:NADH:ubiquinone oxidoreductase subunit F (NADH-binding)/Na+-translocating ferredoxin:NAD+ oxidoreductase RnfD subunit